MQPFGFTGREHELDAALVYARARYLQPSTGRWDRPDPLGFVDGPARYLYVNSAPTAARDPSGWFKAEGHNYIIRQAVSMAHGDATDVPILQAASAAADGPTFQLPGFAFRHGMTDSGQSMASAISQWTSFVTYQLAYAADIATAPLSANRCIPQTEAQRREASPFELGLGMHAVMDWHSPFHRFQVWSFDSSGLNHVRHEGEITSNDPAVIAAILDSRRYYSAFQSLKAIRIGDLQAWAMYLYGYEARMDIDVALATGAP